MKRNAIIFATALAGLALTAGCGASEPPQETEPAAARPVNETAPDSEAVGPAELAQRGQTTAEQKAEMQDAIDEARSRFDELETRVSSLQSEAAEVRDDIDSDLRGTLDRVAEHVSKTRETVESFANGGLEGWKGRREGAVQALEDLEEAVSEARASLDGQKRVLAEREKGLEPVTNEFVALDGGNYDAYRVSVITRVQQELRERGLYSGPADGVLGEPTMRALAAFQKDEGLAPNGVPSPRTRDRLFGSSASS